MRIEAGLVDGSELLVEQVRRAVELRTPLRIRGGDSKAFLGRTVLAEELDTRVHRGIVNHDPSELLVTARAGTPLDQVNRVLDDAGQMLACESPVFGGDATIGGMVASGLAGPRRPWSGSVRDFVLGCRIMTGEGKHLRFGGEVMKNVAGYDLSRVMAGSFGCLGVITEVSLKVLPKPRSLRCLTMAIDAGEALRELSVWRRAALPISGACHVDGRLHVRLEGGRGSVDSAADRLGGEVHEETFWSALRDHRLPFFADSRPLWRLSLPIGSPLVDVPGDVMIDWAGAQVWLKSDSDTLTIRRLAHAARGYATCFTPGVADEPFLPLPESLMHYHRTLKQAFDPRGLFNPGRLNADL
jgi:glycolate oxidase FAD binding subunit